MDTFNDLQFNPNPNRTNWNIAVMSWANGYGIIVNEEESSRIPTMPLNKYQVSVTENGVLTAGIVTPSKLNFVCTPDDITDTMEQLQQL